MKRALALTLAVLAAIALLASCSAGTGSQTVTADKADVDPLGLYKAGLLGGSVSDYDGNPDYYKTIPTNDEQAAIYNKTTDFLGRSGSVVIRAQAGLAQEIAYSFMDNAQLYESADKYSAALSADTQTFLNICDKLATETGSEATKEYTLGGEAKTIDFTSDGIAAAISGDSGDKIFRETFVKGNENIIVILGVYGSDVHTILVSYLLAE